MKWIFVALLMLVSVPALGQAPRAVHEAIEIGLTSAEPHAQVTFALPIADLARDTEFADAHGLLTVRMASRSHGDRVSRVVTLSSDNLRLGQMSLGRLDATIVTPTPDGPSKFWLRIDGPLAQLEASLEANLLVDFANRTLSLAPGALRGMASVNLPSLLKLNPRTGWAATQGSLAITAHLTGTDIAPEINVRAEVERLFWNYQSVGSGHVDWAHKEGVSQFSGQIEEQGLKWLTGEAEIPLDIDLLKRSLSWRDAEALHLSLRVANLTQTRLSPWLPTPPDVRFTLDGTVELAGDLNNIVGAAHLGGTLLSHGYSRHLELDLTTTADTQDLTASLGEDASLRITTHQNLRTWRADGKRNIESNVEGALRADLPLFALEPFLPAVGASNGRITAALALSGTEARPLLEGTVETQSAQLTLIDLNRRLSELSFAAVFSGSNIDFTYGASSYPGSIKGSGSTEFGVPSIWRGSSQVLFEDLPVVRPDFPVALASGTADVTWDANAEAADVQVLLRESKLVLTEEELPETKQIPTNANLRFLSGRGSQDSLFAGIGRLGFVLDASAGIKVDGPQTQMTISETLALQRDGNVVTTEGGLTPKSGGRFELLGNSFAVRDGLVTLAPGNTQRTIPIRSDGFKYAAPLEPVIELVAQAEIEGTLVMVKLNGPLRRPNLTLMSFPILPEYQIITLLVTGRVGTDSRNGDVRRAAAKLVERYHNPSLERQLFDQLGVDKVGLGFGSSVASPILTVGKQITRDLYIETIYHHDAPPDENMMEARVEQRIGEGWTLDTTLGEAAEGRAGVFWATSWGAPVSKPPSPEVWSVKNPSHTSADDDEDGVMNPFDLCPNTAEDMDGFEDADGCEDADNDQDGVPDKVDKAPLLAETYNGVDDGDGAPDEAPTRLQDFAGTARVYRFERRSSQLPAQARRELAAFAEITSSFKKARIVVVGHSDAQGSARRNLAVSTQRAQAMRRELIRAGVKANRIDVVGRGTEEPLENSDSEQAQATNRRVEVHLVFEVKEPLPPEPGPPEQPAIPTQPSTP